MSNSNCDLACEIEMKDDDRGGIKARTAHFTREKGKGGEGGIIEVVPMGATKSGEAYVQKMTQASSRGKSTRYGKGGKS